MFRIPLSTCRNYRILNKHVTSFGTKLTVMIQISEEEEQLIDNINEQTLKFDRDDKTFSVNMHDIYCYGVVDLKDENTINQISNLKFLNYLTDIGYHIFSNYDYDTHSCLSPQRYCLTTETWNPIDLVKMVHGYLGKPERILLFNQTVKKW